MLPYIAAGVVVGLSLFLFARVNRGGAAKAALDPTTFHSFKLTKKTQVSQDSYIFRFALHHDTQTLGLPIGQHIALRALCDVKREVEGEGGTKAIVSEKALVQHSYTPISGDDDKGYVDFLIKVYFADTHPKFPFGGRISQHLYNMKLGDEIEMIGPKGRFEYLGNGNYKIAGRWARADCFAMIAGGTGITPMLQIMRAIRKNPQDRTRVFLVYGNQTEKDILLRRELDELVTECPDQVKVWYTIDREPSPSWTYDVGFVNEKMLREHLPIPEEFSATEGGNPNNVSASKVLALMCGPPLMLQLAIKPHLEKIGYSAETMFSF